MVSADGGELVLQVDPFVVPLRYLIHNKHHVRYRL